MKNGMWYAYMTPDASLIPTPNTDPDTYNGLPYPWGTTTEMAEIPLGVTVHEAWNFMVFNFQEKTNAAGNQISTVRAFRRSADRTQENGFEKRWNHLFVDNNNFYLCLGSSVQYNGGRWEHQYGFVGLINNFAIHQNKLDLWTINDYWSFDCSEYCTICRAID